MGTKVQNHPVLKQSTRLIMWRKIASHQSMVILGTASTASFKVRHNQLIGMAGRCRYRICPAPADDVTDR